MTIPQHSIDSSLHELKTGLRPFPVSAPTQEVATADEASSESDEPAQEAAPTEESAMMEEMFGEIWTKMVKETEFGTRLKENGISIFFVHNCVLARCT